MRATPSSQWGGRDLWISLDDAKPDSVGSRLALLGDAVVLVNHFIWSNPTANYTLEKVLLNIAGPSRQAQGHFQAR